MRSITAKFVGKPWYRKVLVIVAVFLRGVQWMINWLPMVVLKLSVHVNRVKLCSFAYHTDLTGYKGLNGMLVVKRIVKILI